MTIHAPAGSATRERISYVSLAELRYRIRRFLVFSEHRARAMGLEPQHHQLLLAIKGLPPELSPTLGVLAERLQVQHHSCVELALRAEAQGLVTHVVQKHDRRKKVIAITRRGQRVLEKLSAEHVIELSREAPLLVSALEEILGRGVKKESWKPEKTRARVPSKSTSRQK